MNSRDASSSPAARSVAAQARISALPDLCAALEVPKQMRVNHSMSVNEVNEVTGLRRRARRVLGGGPKRLCPRSTEGGSSRLRASSSRRRIQRGRLRDGIDRATQEGDLPHREVRHARSARHPRPARSLARRSHVSPRMLPRTPPGRADSHQLFTIGLRALAAPPDGGGQRFSAGVDVAGPMPQT